MRRIRAGGTCEAPTELYARDTDGRSADSHSPFLFLPPAYPTLAPGRTRKNERGEKPFGNCCESERERKFSRKRCKYLDMEMYVQW